MEQIFGKDYDGDTNSKTYKLHYDLCIKAEAWLYLDKPYRDDFKLGRVLHFFRTDELPPFFGIMDTNDRRVIDFKEKAHSIIAAFSCKLHDCKGLMTDEMQN